MAQDHRIPIRGADGVLRYRGIEFDIDCSGANWRGVVISIAADVVVRLKWEDTRAKAIQLAVGFIDNFHFELTVDFALSSPTSIREIPDGRWTARTDGALFGPEIEMSDLLAEIYERTKSQGGSR